MDESEAVKRLSEFINTYAEEQEVRDNLHDALSVLENIALRGKIN